MSKSHGFLRTRSVDSIWMPEDANKLLRGFSEGHEWVRQPTCFDFNRSCMPNLLYMPPPFCRDLPSLAQDRLKMILGNISHFAYRKCTPAVIIATLTKRKLEGMLPFLRYRSCAAAWNASQTLALSASPLCQTAARCSRLWEAIHKAQPAKAGLAYI